MNKQEIFETVAKHLFEQGKPSYDPVKKMCLYRSDEGCSCAIGKLIPNDNYNAEMENLSASGLMRYSKWTLPEDIFNDENALLLNMLQSVHDLNLEATHLPNNWISSEKMRTALIVAVDGEGINTDFIKDLSFTDR